MEQAFAAAVGGVQDTAPAAARGAAVAPLAGQLSVTQVTDPGRPAALTGQRRLVTGTLGAHHLAAGASLVTASRVRPLLRAVH